MIDALLLYARFLIEFPISKEGEADPQLYLMLNNEDDPQFTLFAKMPHNHDMGLRVVRRFRELGLPVESAPTTDAMLKCVNRRSTGDYATFSFVPDVTRIIVDKHAESMGQAFANDVMRLLPKSLLK
jgi:hypothetical protein